MNAINDMQCQVPGPRHVLVAGITNNAMLVVPVIKVHIVERRFVFTITKTFHGARTFSVYITLRYVILTK